MKKIGFVGAFEKTDLITYVGKILVEAGKRVLFIDTTLMQRARYIVPTIQPIESYVTEFEKIDVAVGYKDLESLNRYLGHVEVDYDVALIDVDSPKMFETFNLASSDILYFVTAFDNFSLKRGVQILERVNHNVKMTKVLFERQYSKENDEYLNFLSEKTSIEWDENIVFFPYDQGDLSEIIENQRVAKIKFRNLSEQYRYGLYSIVQMILPEVNSGVIKKIMKSI